MAEKCISFKQWKNNTEFGVINMVSAYDELPRTPANFVALSPLRYLERAAYIYPSSRCHHSWAPSYFMA
jgi:hypothetical protein